MIDPAEVAFDVDGVIADTMSLFLDIARDEYHIEGIRAEDMTCYNLEACLDLEPDVILAILDRILSGNYSGTLKPIDGSPVVLTRIARYRRPLLFVTARTHSELIQQWLEQMLPLDRGSIQVVATGTFDGKAAVLLERGVRYFVEDRLETCFQLKNSGIEPVLFSQPWNRQDHPFIEVKSWGELEELFAFRPLQQGRQRG
jgi:5'(3')-deoxyribonucleotidase